MILHSRFAKWFAQTRSKGLTLSGTKGFTLVELLMYMGLLAILLTMLVSVFSAALDVQLESDATSAVEQDGRFVIAHLTHEVTSASSLTTPVGLGQSGETLAIVENGVASSYTIDGNGNLLLTTGGTSYQLNSYDTTVSQLFVQRIGNVGGVEDTVQIRFTITSKTERVNGPEVRAYQTTLALRRQ